jgi:hypothetical protein
MSLDVYLTSATAHIKPRYVPVREGGTILKMTEIQYLEKYGKPPVAIIEEELTNEIFSGNITHNLGKMARAAEIYECLWEPETLGITTAHQLLPHLAKGYSRLFSEPEKFIPLNPENGWGNYELFVEFVCKYASACIENPDAKVSVCR